MQRRIPFGVQWQPNPSAEPIPLNDLTLERGNWQLGQLYLQMRTAKSWGLTPYEWYEKSLGERMLMMSFDVVDMKMQAYEHAWYERNSKPKE